VTDLERVLADPSSEGLARVDEDGDLIVSPLPAEQIPAEGEALAQAVAARLPQIHLPALLIEVHRDTRVSEAFTHAGGAQPRNPDLTRTSTVLSASRRILRPWICCHCLNPDGGGTCGHGEAVRGSDVITVGGVRTWTRVSETLRNAASAAAQSTATVADGDPSTPTTMPRCVAQVDISIPSLTVFIADIDAATVVAHNRSGLTAIVLRLSSASQGQTSRRVVAGSHQPTRNSNAAAAHRQVS
jgi:hypothetical protein